MVPAAGSGSARAALPARVQVVDADAATIEIRADALGLPLATGESADLYDGPAVQLEQGDRVAFDVAIPREGVYTLSFDMAATGTSINAPEGALLVDGAAPSDDASGGVQQRNAGRIILPNFYTNTADEFPLDRYGNEALIRQKRLIHWTRVPVRDASFSQPYPLALTLAAGEHRFEFELTRESILLGSITLEPFAEYPDYSQYLAANTAPDSSGVLIELEAEFPSYKNDTAIRPVNNRSLGVTPYDTYRLLLNTLGGEKWQRRVLRDHHTRRQHVPDHPACTAEHQEQFYGLSPHHHRWGSAIRRVERGALWLFDTVVKRHAGGR